MNRELNKKERKNSIFVHRNLWLGVAFLLVITPTHSTHFLLCWHSISVSIEEKKGGKYLWIFNGSREEKFLDRVGYLCASMIGVTVAAYENKIYGYRLYIHEAKSKGEVQNTLFYKKKYVNPLDLFFIPLNNNNNNEREYCTYTHTMRQLHL